MEDTLELFNFDIDVYLCRIRLIDDWIHDAMPAPFWRLYWNPSPGAWIQRHDQHVELNPSHQCLVPPGDTLATGLDRPCQHLFLHFSIANDLRPKHDKLYAFPCTKQQRHDFKDLKNHIQKRTDKLNSNILARQLIYSALSQIPQEDWPEPISDCRIALAVEAIHQHPKHHISVEALAKRVHLHPKSFTRLFKMHIKQAPAYYMLQLRLNAASRDLMHHDDSVESIAERWHFSDRFHLTRMLKKHRGITPGQLRRYAT